ncbi:MAG TPA: hypothetical protein VKZ44_07655 [Taishania sp.]|nr:hypothetical protein [Taishania sp.]
MNTKYINYVLSSFVIIVCLVWIYFLIFSDEFIGGLPRLQRQVLTGILSLYAIFRTYRLYQMVQRDKINKRHDEE